MNLNRRMFLTGIGGVTLGLPWLESVAGRSAWAQDSTTAPFAIFFRQANGVAQNGSNNALGDEPERFWPRATGALTPESMQDRAVDELVRHRDHLLLVRGVNMENFDYGDGHARGALQGLTARGPTSPGQGGSSEAAGVSIDHRIGADLNPEGRESMFLYAGRNSGWLGGACISYRGPGNRRAPLHNPWNAYQSFVGGDGALSPDAQQALVNRKQSVNDLVRGQLSALTSSPRLSSSDRQRLQLHLDSIRDLEVTLTCQMAEDQARQLENEAPGFDSTNGDEVLQTARLHLDVATLAVACGHTRSVALQVGSGNDGSTRYRNLMTGELMENFHYVSHRRLSHGGDGTVIQNADVLHHYVDRQFAQVFGHLLDRLSAYNLPEGGTLLEKGLAIWYNDLSNGPPHGRLSCPFIIGGSANRQLRQGQFIDLDMDQTPNHNRMLSTIGAAVGLTNSAGAPLDDFGDPGLPRGRLDTLLV